MLQAELSKPGAVAWFIMYFVAILGVTSGSYLILGPFALVCIVEAAGRLLAGKVDRDHSYHLHIYLDVLFGCGLVALFFFTSHYSMAVIATFMLIVDSWIRPK